MNITPLTPVQSKQVSSVQKQNQPPNAKQLLTDRFERSVPKFSGRKMADDQSAKQDLAKEIEDHKTKIKQVEDDANNGAAKGFGLGVGAGSMGTMAVGGADFGNIALWSGNAGMYIGDKISRYNSSKKHGDPEYHRGQKDAKQRLYDHYTNCLDTARTQIKHMEEVEKKAKTALQAEGVFKDAEYKALAAGVHNPRYDEVSDKATVVKPKAGRVPGFVRLYERITGKRWNDDPVKDLQHDLDSGDPDTQMLALRRYYPMDNRNTDKSIPLYHSFLSNQEPKVAATALRMMNENPVLRGTDQQYTQTLEKFLASGEPEKIQAAFEGLMASKLKSNTINLLLERISHPSAPYSQELKNEALRVASHRYTQGTNRELNPRETSRRILEGMVGNQDMQRQLMKVIHQYQGALRAAGNNSPALVLYLEGSGGIGKTTMLQRLQTELHNDPNGLKVIKMGDLRDQEDLLRVLREAQPLQGKTIFLDEFQYLDNPELERGRPGIMRVLKNLFATEDETGTGEHEMKAVHGIDVKDTILAVATNKPLDQMTSLADPDLGQSVRSRILGPAHYLDLEPDMRKYLPQLVEGFSQHRYYDKVKKRTFDGSIILSEQAKEALMRELTELSRRTPDHSGRNYVNQISKEIDTAIGTIDINTRKKLATDDKGRITDSLTIEVDEDGFLVAKPTV